MRTVIAAFLFLASPVLAQEDVYRELALGDRVQVTFRHGATVTGMLVAIVTDPKVRVEKLDYTKETLLTLDMSWEYPGLNGTMSIAKDQVKEIRKLQPLDATTRRMIEEQRKIVEELKKKDEEERKLANRKKDEEREKKIAEFLAAEAAKGNEADALKKVDGLKKSLELRKKFPPGEYGAKTLEEVQQRTVRRQPITPDQREFMDNYKTWLLAEQFDEIKSTERKEVKKETPEEKKP